MFEELFRDFIQEQLIDKLSITVREGMTHTVYEPDVNAAQEMYFHPLQDNADSIIAVISGGNTTRSKTPTIDTNTVPLYVRVYCEYSKKDKVLKALRDIEEDYNAAYMLLSSDSESYTTQLTFYSATLAATPFPLKSKNETIDVVQLLWPISAFYTTNISLKFRTFSLQFDGMIYPINGISRYTMAEQPNSRISQKIGESRGHYQNAILTTTTTFIITELTNDVLHELLYKEFLTGNEIYDKTMRLRTAIGTDSYNISISDYTLDYENTNGVGVFTLTLIK